MRQTRLFQENNPDKINLRVTRGHSDLPKQQQKEQQVEEEESISQEEQDGVPKVKKIHHMTLKAMERKKILAELAALQGITLEQKPVVKIPKKRGRPKGYKKPVIVQEDFIVNEMQQMVSLSGVSQKKEINLRKRDSTKKFLDADSQMVNQNEAQIQQQKEVVMQIKVQQPPKPIIQQPLVQPSVQTVIPHMPKKRGRKKKIQPEMGQLSTVPKIFTVPKTQTYDNYNKYYRKITEESKQENGGEVPLIFDKLNNSEGYEQLLRKLQLKQW